MRKLFYVLGIALGSVLCLAMPSWAAEEETNSTPPAFGNFSQENDQIELQGTLVGGVDFKGVVPELPADIEYWTPQRLAGVEKAMQAGLMALEGAIPAPPGSGTIDGESEHEAVSTESSPEEILLGEQQADSLDLPPLTSVGSTKEILGAVSDLVVQAALANQLGVGINFDYESNVVIVTTDIESENVLRAIFEDSSTYSSLKFVSEDTFEAFQEESWHGGQSFGDVCTGAFPAARGNETGIVTAAHCVIDTPTYTAPIAYEGSIIQNVYASGPSEDVAFVALLESPSGLVRMGGSIYQTIFSAKNPSVGESVIRVGRGLRIRKTNGLLEFTLEF